MENPAETGVKKEGYFPALTGIRAIAAYMVFVHHYDKLPVLGEVIYKFNREFYAGVTFFFVLSGFLIYYRYGDIKGLSFSWLSVYARNRFARIYPVYFILLTATYLYFSFPDFKQTFFNYTLLKGFVNSYKFNGIGQSWSLTVEECFYFSAPFIFLFIARWPKMKFALWGGSIIIALLAGLVTKNIDFIVGYTFLGRFTEFFAGMYLAELVKSGRVRLKFKITYPALASIFLVLFINSRLSPDDASGTYPPISGVLMYLLLPVLVASFYYGLLMEQSLVRAVLSSRLFGLLGKSSYVFYLIHVGFIATILELFSTNVAVNFIILNLIAILIYKFVEKPLNEWLRAPAQTTKKPELVASGSANL